MPGLANEGFQMGPLIVKIVETCLDNIIKSEGDVVEAQVLCYTIATEVMCDLEHCKSLLWYVNKNI